MFNHSKIVMFKSFNPNNMLAMLIYDEKTLIAIDGNFGIDSLRMIEYIKSLNRDVDYWIITHTHADHIGTISNAIENCEFRIKNIVFDIPSREETLSLTRKDTNLLNTVQKFYASISKYKGNIIIPELKKYKFGSFDLEFFKIGKNENHYDLNCYSLVFKVNIEDKMLLATSDLLEDDSNKLVEEQNIKLKSDIVTVSHHGHGGASNSFYELVNPTIALWPSVEECYLNIGDNGPNSGPFDSDRIRDILSNMNVDIRCSYLGDIEIV